MNGSRKFQCRSANDTEISHSAKKTGKWIYILKETLCIHVCLSKEDIHTFTRRKCSIIGYTSKSMNDNVQTSVACEHIEYSGTVPGVAAMCYYLPIPFSLLLSRDAFSKSTRGKIQGNLIWCWNKDGGMEAEKPLSILLGEETKTSASSKWRGTSADSLKAYLPPNVGMGFEWMCLTSHLHAQFRNSWSQSCSCRGQC